MCVPNEPPFYTYQYMFLAHYHRMSDVKAHAMYEGLDWDRLEEKSRETPWVPEEPAPFPEPETPNANDVYTGDQASTVPLTQASHPECQP